VALYIWQQKTQSCGGSRLRPETIQLREAEEIRVKALASRLMLAVRKRLKNLDVYALRHTHGTWAADQEVPEIHISKQLGHRIQGITGRYISSRSVKLIDPGRSSRAVWEMLIAAERAAAPAAESAVMNSAIA
jgi:integrase